LACGPRPGATHIERQRRGLAALLGLGVFLGGLALGPGPAHGQPAGARELTPADRETARALMDDGDDKLARGNVRGALDAYLGADKIMGVPTTGLDVGRTQAKLGLLLEARDTLLRVTRFPQDPSEPEAYTKARAAATALALELGVRIPSLQIDVTGPNDDTAIEASVDGVALPAGTHRHVRKVNPGEKVIRARAEGFRAAEQRVAVREREQRVVRLRLEPLPPSPEAAGPSPLVWLGFSLGGAGLAVGTVTGVLSMVRASELKEQCQQDVCPAAVAEDIDGAMLLANVSNVGLAVGAAGVVLGLVGVAISGDDTPDDGDGDGDAATLELAPMIGPTGFGISGRF
jgi:hypothetical protein